MSTNTTSTDTMSTDTMSASRKTQVTAIVSNAIRAARNRNSWGRYATARFLENRCIPFSLYRLARQLVAGDLCSRNATETTELLEVREDISFIIRE